MLQAYFSPCAHIRGSVFVVPRATRCLLCLLTIPCGAGLLSNLATLYKEDGNYRSAAYNDFDIIRNPNPSPGRHRALASIINTAALMGSVCSALGWRLDGAC